MKMPKCRNCGKNITRYDKEFCPYCGCKNPLDSQYVQTSDITQTIETMKTSSGDNEHYTYHKKSVNAVLCMFGGIFALDSFYLGFKGYGAVRIVLNLSIYVGVFFLLFFLDVLTLLRQLLIPFFGLFLLYFIFGIVVALKKDKKDANGEFLR
jgi:hypothetical protein